MVGAELSILDTLARFILTIGLLNDPVIVPILGGKGGLDVQWPSKNKQGHHLGDTEVGSASFPAQR